MEALVSIVLFALLAISITRVCASTLSCESRALQRLHATEIARRGLDRFSCGQEVGQEAGYLVTQVTWKEPFSPKMTWVAVTVSSDDGGVPVTLLGNRASV